MDRLKMPVGVVALVATIGVLTFMNPDSGQAQNGTAPVRVVNTPLPISGNVSASVTGNVSATLSGPVSLQPDTVVNIGNSETAPVPVRDVASAKVPVQGFAGCFYNANGSCLVDLTTVPAGFRLVIENISGNTYMFGADRVGSVVVGRAFLGCCIATNAGYLVPHAVEGTSNYNINNQTLMFFDEGDTVRVLLSKFISSVEGGGVANLAYAGYLIPK